MMRRLTLTEFRTAPAVPLTASERDAIRRLYCGMVVEPTLGRDGFYDLTPDQHIGVVAIPGLTIEIRPKVPMRSVLFMVSYTCEKVSWRDEQPEFLKDTDLVEVMAMILARSVERATHRGLLTGYRSEDESLQAPRGRILFDEQIRRRFAQSPPVEVRHDVYTTDILENRLLLAALTAMSRFPIRSAEVKKELRRAQRAFGGVSEHYFSAAKVPDVVITRLNRHYDAALSLAGLVLRSASLNLGASGPRGSAFLVNMNSVFEEFVRVALRRALGADTRSFPDKPPRTPLDEGGRVGLRPDLCLVRDGRVEWVGDAKYKRLPAGAYRHADLYQLLAYATAFDLPGGMLIYAADEGVSSADYEVRYAGKRLEVRAIDLSKAATQVLEQVRVLGEQAS